MDIAIGLRFISEEEAKAISHRGFRQSLKRLTENVSPNAPLTHKEVRTIAKACLILLPNFDFSIEDSAEIRFLLAGAAAFGLNIDDRAILAQCVLRLVNWGEPHDADICF